MEDKNKYRKQKNPSEAKTKAIVCWTFTKQQQEKRSCLHTTNCSIPAWRSSTSCQADFSQVPGWKGWEGNKLSASPLPPTPHHGTLTLPSAHLNPQHQASLLLKVNRRLSGVLTANQLQEHTETRTLGQHIKQRLGWKKKKKKGTTTFKEFWIISAD